MVSLLADVFVGAWLLFSEVLKDIILLGCCF